MTTVIVVADLKGGSGKTTTAVFLAHQLHAWGRSVVLVDGDAQQSANTWFDLAGWPFPAVDLSMATRMRQLFGVVDRDRFDTVIIDTPPLDDDRSGVVVEALRHATVVIVPLAPTSIELHRIPATWAAIDRAAPNAVAAVLLNRCVTNASSTGIVRDALTTAGRTVMNAEIPKREAYAQAFAAPVSTSDVPYSRVAEELIGWGVA